MSDREVVLRAIKNVVELKMRLESSLTMAAMVDCQKMALRSFVKKLKEEQVRN